MFGELEAETGGFGDETVEQDLTWLTEEGYLKNVGVKRARPDEMEADLHGIAYAAAAGYDPRAMSDLLERIQTRHSGQDMFLHHPPVSDRIRAVRKAIAGYRLARRGQKRFAERYRTHVRDTLTAGAGKPHAE